MKFAASTLMFTSLLATTAAFGVRPSVGAAAVSSRRAFTSASKPLLANVPRLSEPQGQLLDQVDTFIFDCDGVIWRVRESNREYITFDMVLSCFSMVSFGENRHSRFDMIFPILESSFSPFCLVFLLLYPLYYVIS